MENLSYGNQPLSPATGMPPEKNNSSKTIIIVVAVVVAVLFLILGVTAGYFIARNLGLSQSPAAKTDQSETNGLASTSSDSQAASSEIIWSAPKEIPEITSLFTPAAPGLSALNQYSKAYAIGRFSSGKYQEADLILLSAYPDGPAMYPGYFRFVKQGANYILLQNNSEIVGEEYRLNKNNYTVDSDYRIKELMTPDQLLGPKGENLQRDQFVRYFFSLNNLKLVYNDSVYGNVYTTNIVKPQPDNVLDRNGFYLQLPDGTVAVYQLKTDMFDESIAPKITWTDGKINTQTYSHTDVSGCGSGNYASVVDSNGFDLVKIGRTANGEDIFAFADTNNYYYKNLYDTKYQVLDGQKKMSYKDFLAGKPLFFWYDSFGRLIKFESTKFQPLAECGKPVIYLYPTATTVVSVKLAPVGGFSYTEPAYNNGWLVEAQPSGQLTELSSGKKYPYLFWEGRGGVYGTPSRGFTVKRAEVRSFLIEKLGKFNLNQQEINDFLEFWLPRMQAKPYYFITFLGKAEMDRLAPLSIDPKPDTIIRVLMDFTPLDYAQPSIGYDISAPARNGFTVIEWGGVLRK